MPIARRIDARIVVPVGLVFSVAAYLLIALGAGTTVTGLAIAFVVLGIGIGIAETVSNDLILASVPPAKAGAASAVSETAYELGAVLGTTVLGGILTALYRSGIEIPAGVPADAADAARETLAGAFVAAQQLPDAIGDALREAAALAFESGVTVTAIIGAVLVVGAGVIAATTLGAVPTAPEASTQESNVARRETGRHPG